LLTHNQKPIVSAVLFGRKSTIVILTIRLKMAVPASLDIVEVAESDKASRGEEANRRRD
jgi:hypothetical protein